MNMFLKNNVTISNHQFNENRSHRNNIINFSIIINNRKMKNAYINRNNNKDFKLRYIDRFLNRF